MGVYIAPLSTSAIHTLAVALDVARGVDKGETGALAAKVGVGRSSLLYSQGGNIGYEDGENNWSNSRHLQKTWSWNDEKFHFDSF